MADELPPCGPSCTSPATRLQAATVSHARGRPHSAWRKSAAFQAQRVVHADDQHIRRTDGGRAPSARWRNGGLPISARGTRGRPAHRARGRRTSSLRVAAEIGGLPGSAREPAHRARGRRTRSLRAAAEIGGLSSQQQRRSARAGCRHRARGLAPSANSAARAKDRARVAAEGKEDGERAAASHTSGTGVRR
jgi:hypothetical protein